MNWTYMMVLGKVQYKLYEFIYVLPSCFELSFLLTGPGTSLFWN